MNEVLMTISNLEVNSWEWSSWALIGCLLVLAINMSVFHLYSKKMKRENDEVRKLQKDLRALITASVGMGQRMLEVERRHRRLAERQDQLDIYESANQSYEHAIKMSQNGSDVNELINICGMSKTEAELINMIHSLDKTA
ncbi:MAG: DUF2802 domain-containing protein [Gammaproteobacteria bacterium]|nr:DUF2802 domain-containing protein [Gammaproteobacteria bacterium]